MKYVWEIADIGRGRQARTSPSHPSVTTIVRMRDVDDTVGAKAFCLVSDDMVTGAMSREEIAQHFTKIGAIPL